MYSFGSELVEPRFRVATRSARAGSHRYRQFVAVWDCRCVASWRRAHSPGGTWRASASREPGATSSHHQAEESEGGEFHAQWQATSRCDRVEKWKSPLLWSCSYCGLGTDDAHLCRDAD